MLITVAGLSHQTAPVEVREQLAFTTPGLLPRAVAALRADLGLGVELLLLSTCNRTELYTVYPDSQNAPSGMALLTHLLRVRGIHENAHDWQPYWEEKRGHRAVEHLFRVAGGLESMVLGEDDIVRQVKEAYAVASDAGATGAVLNPLVHEALRVAKRVKTETGLARGAFSVGHAAAQVAEGIFGDLKGRTVLLLGAGAMSETTARHLAANGATSIIVANRTFDRAAQLAEVLNGRAIRYDEFPQALVKADIVVASTSAPHPVVTQDMVEPTLRARRNRPLYLIDIAVPRDISDDVGDLPNVFLYNIDHFQAVLDTDLAERKQRAARAEALVHEEAVAHVAKLRAKATAQPLVTAVRARVDTLAQFELARLRARLPHLNDDEWRAIEQSFAAFGNKIAHAPTVKIKEYAANTDFDSDAQELRLSTVRELFGIEDTGAGSAPDEALCGRM